MTDTPEILAKSRKYFRDFLSEHMHDIFLSMKEYRVGPGSGYGYFYRSEEIVQCIRNIYHNLSETFGGLTIPGEFTSPQHLVKTWKRFYEYLVSEDQLFEEVHNKLTVDAKKKYGKDFENYMKSGMVYPMPFTGIADIHAKVKDVLRYVLEMDDVKEVLNEKSIKTVELREHRNIIDGEMPSNIPVESVFDIAITTAIYEPELRRVREILVNPTPLVIVNDPTVYTRGEIVRKDGSLISVVIASDGKMGMPAASTLATKMIYNFNPKYLVMLGICAGINGKTNEGDIIIAEFAWDYGSGKREKVKGWFGTTKEVFKPYIFQIQLDVHLETLFKNLVHQNKYVGQIQAKWNTTKAEFQNPLRALIGPFASGSAVIANEDIVAEINSNHGKLLGFDMEAYSVFNSARFTPAIKTKPIVIKSVSDFGDSNKNSPNKDLLQDYAAFTSAQYFLQIAINDLTY